MFPTRVFVIPVTTLLLVAAANSALAAPNSATTSMSRIQFATRVALNPQPIPPGRGVNQALNPQPIPPGRSTFDTNRVSTVTGMGWVGARPQIDPAPVQRLR